MNVAVGRFMGIVAIGVYLLVLATFMGSNVTGGVKGGTVVGTHREGRTIVTEYAGGEQTILEATPDRASQVKHLGFLTLAVGGVIGLVYLARGKFEIIGGAVGGAFIGALLAFVTGMPLGKKVPGEAFWYVLWPLYGLAVIFVLVRGGRWGED